MSSVFVHEEASVEVADQTILDLLHSIGADFFANNGTVKVSKMFVDPKELGLPFIDRSFFRFHVTARLPNTFEDWELTINPKDGYKVISSSCLRKHQYKVHPGRTTQTIYAVA